MIKIVKQYGNSECDLCSSTSDDYYIYKIRKLGYDAKDYYISLCKECIDGIKETEINV